MAQSSQLPFKLDFYQIFNDWALKFLSSKRLCLVVFSAFLQFMFKECAKGQ